MKLQKTLINESYFYKIKLAWKCINQMCCCKTLQLISSTAINDQTWRKWKKLKSEGFCMSSFNE